MGYKSKSVQEVVRDIRTGKMYLPAIQRKFVWDKPQIELLFDSIMRGYPIGTFLFWNLKKDTAKNYVFYDFLLDYHQKNPYNRRNEGSFPYPEIIGVLDGQQRLSSLYIGLQGTHTEKQPRKHYNNEDAYKKTRLYLNLLSLPYTINEQNKIIFNEEANFEFRFLTEEDSKNWIKRKIKQTDDDGNTTIKEDLMYWFKVGDVLNWPEDPEFNIYIDEFIDKCIDEKQKKAIENSKRFIDKTITTLYNKVTSEENKLINYFEITKDDLEDILKIFVRVNSGGTALSKTDLLFSTIVATWDDGRDKIEELLKTINQKGDKFTFGNEFLMRCCLVLTDSSVLFKVKSFKSENVQKIKDDWKNLASAITKTVDLLVAFGFNGTLLTSQNSIIIIAYYIYKGGLLNDTIKAEIKQYLIHALLKGVYGASQDQLITKLREALRSVEKDESGKETYKLSANTFSFKTLLELELPSNKTFYISDKDLERFLSYKKGTSSFLVLSLLYPNLRYNEVQFHQDHIHPASKFSSPVFDEISINEEERKSWLELRDTVPNLQFMESRENVTKNATPFSVWLAHKNDSEVSYFKASNHIPVEESLEFSNFKSFYENRKTILKNELKKVLAINNDINSGETNEEDFIDQETEGQQD